MHSSPTSDQVFTLKHKVVRDLYWSLWGSELFIHPQPYSQLKELFPLDWNWVQEQDLQPELIVTFLESKNTQLLGTYFEALWHFYFTYHPSVLYCTTNVQVNDKKRTIGEFDVLITMENGQSFHIELACKFYLQWHSENLDPMNKSRHNDHSFWIGPNCNDRLDIKYNKTCNHQLPLLKTKLGLSKAYAALGLVSPQEIQQIAIWRGQLFYKNHWFKEDELKEIPQANNNETMWFIADKNNWLSPITLNDKRKLLPFEEARYKIHQHFNTAKHSDNVTLKNPAPQMLIALSFHSKTRQWRQSCRYFITSNSWPYGTLSDKALTPLLPCKPPL